MTLASPGETVLGETIRIPYCVASAQKLLWRACGIAPMTRSAAAEKMAAVRPNPNHISKKRARNNYSIR